LILRWPNLYAMDGQLHSSACVVRFGCVLHVLCSSLCNQFF
jgi:hypothetical protein